MADNMDYQKVKAVLKEEPERIILSNRADKEYLYKKTVLHRMILKGSAAYQIERFTDKQAFHENIPAEKLTQAVLAEFPERYSQMNVFAGERQWDFKVTKKGKLLFSAHANSGKQGGKEQGTAPGVRRITIEGESTVSHNRRKHYLLPEGTVVAPLVDLGIFTKEGKVVRSMYDKYRQINRFLELVEDVIKDYGQRDMHIIDFGCGKSYLTFILYYYLVEIKGLRVHMTGLDLKADVIAKCNATAEKYQYENLHFELGDINGYRTKEPVDMVITLHACDTATDYALYNAVSWKADIILSVPCCQHEVNKQLVSEEFSLLTKYGIVKERVSALMTDAIRANVLEYCGYKTQLVEFIDIAHSPKNILIRAVKGSISGKKREKAREEVERLCREFHIRQTLADMMFGEADTGNM